jgi:hypothetical protein
MNLNFLGKGALESSDIVKQTDGTFKRISVFKNAGVSTTVEEVITKVQAEAELTTLQNQKADIEAKIVAKQAEIAKFV